MVLITSKQDGFRRCGVSHPAQPTSYPDGRFTGEQIEILKAEPMLVVTEVEDAKKEASRPNANETIAMAKTAESIAALDELAEGEDRKSVLAAIEARRKELSA
ncbi:MAG: HI1506-related protein [Desulfobulbaceae bacterium]|nr:HI1506-related protein [Desulfobulbaceae bacterium]